MRGSEARRLEARPADCLDAAGAGRRLWLLPPSDAGGLTTISLSVARIDDDSVLGSGLGAGTWTARGRADCARGAREAPAVDARDIATALYGREGDGIGAGNDRVPRKNQSDE